MRLSDVLDLSLDSTWVTLRVCVLLYILVIAAAIVDRLLLEVFPAMMNRVLVYEVIRVRRAIMTIREACVRWVRCCFSLIVVPLLILVLILLKTNATGLFLFVGVVSEC